MNRSKESLAFCKSCWNYNCPKCRKARMFKEPLELTNPLDMFERCEKCGQNFEPEPGFYFGAMIISYIISSVVFLGTALILVFGLEWSVGASLTTVIVLGLIGYLKLLRLSRSLWLHMMVRFDPN